MPSTSRFPTATHAGSTPGAFCARLPPRGRKAEQSPPRSSPLACRHGARRSAQAREIGGQRCSVSVGKTLRDLAHHLFRVVAAPSRPEVGELLFEITGLLRLETGRDEIVLRLQPVAIGAGRYVVGAAALRDETLRAYHISGFDTLGRLWWRRRQSRKIRGNLVEDLAGGLARRHAHLAVVVAALAVAEI